LGDLWADLLEAIAPYLPEGIKVLERCSELSLSTQTKDLLLRISRSSIDRCLAPARFNKPHGLSTTKPGTLLKKNIRFVPLRIGTKTDLALWRWIWWHIVERVPEDNS
jgi:hypothetical protein